MRVLLALFTPLGTWVLQYTMGRMSVRETASPERAAHAGLGLDAGKAAGAQGEKAEGREKGKKRGTKNGRHVGLLEFLTFQTNHSATEGPPLYCWGGYWPALLI